MELAARYDPALRSFFEDAAKRAGPKTRPAAAEGSESGSRRRLLLGFAALIGLALLSFGGNRHEVRITEPIGTIGKGQFHRLGDHVDPGWFIEDF